jgi:hypothetical protein
MSLNLQAFIDDSITPGAEFVLGGHIASAGAWARFAKKWEELLPSGTLAKNNKYHFKMSQMALLEERMIRVPAFYWIIEEHVLVSLSCRLNLADLAAAQWRVERWCDNQQWTNIDWGKWKNPYFVTFRCLMDRFHNARKQFEAIIPLTETVDFIFDNQTEKSFILAAWDDYIDARPDDIRDYYGAKPRFEDDQKFLPLQAADFWAWWVREWYEEDADALPPRMEAFDFFGRWRGKKRPCIAISFDEQEIFEALKGIAFVNAPRVLAERNLLGSP